MNLPSVKTLERAFPGHGKALRSILKPVATDKRRWSYALSLANDLLGYSSGVYGTEYIAHRDDTPWTLYGLTYLNTGDTYNTTLLFDHSSRTFKVTSWGDIVERSNKYV